MTELAGPDRAASAEQIGLSHREAAASPPGHASPRGATAPRDAQSWKGPYLKGEIPNDPWGRPYSYECPGKHNPTSYDLMSQGADGRAGGDDDITNWQQTKR